MMALRMVKLQDLTPKLLWSTWRTGKMAEAAGQVWDLMDPTMSLLDDSIPTEKRGAFGERAAQMTFRHP